MDLWSVLTVALTLVILGFLYWRMIKREVPERIGAFQAVLPFGLGILSMLLYGPFIMWFIRNVLTRLSFGNSPPFAISLIKAFLTAGGTEEALKLIFILITLAVLRSRVDNVYEYVLIGAAVGAGFTVTEEFLYADEGAVITLIGRMVSVAAHMAFNMIMAEFLGKARVSKRNGKGSPTLNNGQGQAAGVFPVTLPFPSGGALQASAELQHRGILAGTAEPQESIRRGAAPVQRSRDAVLVCADG